MNEKYSVRGWSSLEEVLNRLPFVTWDRYVEWTSNQEKHWVKVYGWIDREDEYKDFLEVVVDLTEKEIFDYLTSSAEYHDVIHEKLGFDPEQSNPCKRVEDLDWDVNAVELQQTTEGDTD